jgi:hypothetical protein
MLEAVVSFDKFVEVLPVAGHAKSADVLLLVKGIEVFQAAFSLAVNIRTSDTVNIDGRSFPRLEVNLTDDLGNNYTTMMRGGSGGMMNDWGFTYACSPALDSAAKELLVSVPRINFDNGMMRPNAPAPTVLEGNWQIKLALPGRGERNEE